MVSDLTDRLGPEILTVLEIEGQVLHRVCLNVKVPGWLLNLNALLTTKLRGDRQNRAGLSLTYSHNKLKRDVELTRPQGHLEVFRGSSPECVDLLKLLFHK